MEKAQKSALLNVMIVGSDEDEKVALWIKETFRNAKIPCRIRTTCTLRLCSPEIAIHQQDVIILIWQNTQLVSLEEVVNRKTISSRSCEGALCDLELRAGKEKLRRVMVVGSNLRREDAVFLAEYSCRTIVSLPDKPTNWGMESKSLIQKALKLHEVELAYEANPVNSSVKTFETLLKSWDRVSDMKKMQASEGLLHALGDSARYCELIAEKCQRENDVRGAEKWLISAVNKNPSYLSAQQRLADLYLRQSRPKEALALLEKLKANNPRNFHRLTKMGKCYMQMGEMLKAERALADALAIDEFYPEAREELGKIKMLMGEFDAARNLLSLSKNGKNLASFLNALGIKLVEQRRYQESIEHYKRAQFVLPGNDASHLLFFNIGLAYAKWGKVPSALKYIRLALIREPCYERARTLLQSLQGKATQGAPLAPQN